MGILQFLSQSKEALQGGVNELQQAGGGILKYLTDTYKKEKEEYYKPTPEVRPRDVLRESKLTLQNIGSKLQPPEMSQGEAMKQGLVKAGNTYIDPMFVGSLEKVGAKAVKPAVKPLVGKIMNKVDDTLNPLITEARKYKSENNSLMVLHNLTEANYLKAKEIGGLANPSMAIADVNKGLFDSYGDITLVGDKFLPFSGKGKTYGGDIYSPRFPSTNTKLEDFRVIENRLKPYEELTGEKLWDLDSSDIYTSLENSSLAMVDFLKSKGKTIPKSTGYDLKNKLRDIISESKLKDKFQEHILSLIKSAGGSEQIFKGFTPMGNRKYIPLTAENASKEMNKKSIRAGEGFNYGLGSVRARVAPELKSEAQIRKFQSEGKIVSKEEFDKLKVTYEEKYWKLLEDFEKYDSIKIDNPFEAIDIRSEVIAEYLGGIDRGFFRQKFPNVPDSLMLKLNKFREELKNMPTQYPETKFKRVVQPNEFKYAVVPDNVSIKTIEKFKEDGIKIIKYKAGDSKSRIEALNKLKPLVAFSLLMAVLSNNK